MIISEDAVPDRFEYLWLAHRTIDAILRPARMSSLLGSDVAGFLLPQSIPIDVSLQMLVPYRKAG